MFKVSTKLSLSWLFVNMLNHLKGLGFWLLQLNHLNSLMFFRVRLGLFGRPVFVFMFALLVFRCEFVMVIRLGSTVALLVVI